MDRSPKHLKTLSILLTVVASFSACKKASVDPHEPENPRLSSADQVINTCLSKVQSQLIRSHLKFVNLPENAADDAAGIINAMQSAFSDQDTRFIATWNHESQAVSALALEKSRGSVPSGPLDQLQYSELSIKEGVLMLSSQFVRLQRGLPEWQFSQDFVVEAGACAFRPVRTTSLKFSSSPVGSGLYQVDAQGMTWQIGNQPVAVSWNLGQTKPAFVTAGGVWTREKIALIRLGRNQLLPDSAEMPILTLDAESLNSESYRLPVLNQKHEMQKYRVAVFNAKNELVQEFNLRVELGRLPNDSLRLGNLEKVSIPQEIWLRQTL